jgi:hypothetical protein
MAMEELLRESRAEQRRFLTGWKEPFFSTNVI